MTRTHLKNTLGRDIGQFPKGQGARAKTYLLKYGEPAATPAFRKLTISRRVADSFSACFVAPPRRIALDTPSSSRLASETNYLATRLESIFEMGSKVSAIIAVLNEEKTIGKVLSAVLESSLVTEVIVVDDGSEDSTAEIAERAGARVLRLPENRGKAAAMEAGVELAAHDVILFADGDLVGLTPDHVRSLIEPVLTGKYGMFVGITDKKRWWLNRIIRFLPLLSGNRALRRGVWQAVPPKYKEGFQIEVALNYFGRQEGWRLGFELLEGVHNTIKEKKYGLLLGLWKRVGMSFDVGSIIWKLHIWQKIKSKTHKENK